jgi:hypothetical protein
MYIWLKAEPRCFWRHIFRDSCLYSAANELLIWAKNGTIFLLSLQKVEDWYHLINTNFIFVNFVDQHNCESIKKLYSRENGLKK